MTDKQSMEPILQFAIKRASVKGQTMANMMEIRQFCKFMWGRWHLPHRSTKIWCSQLFAGGWRTIGSTYASTSTWCTWTEKRGLHLFKRLFSVFIHTTFTPLTNLKSLHNISAIVMLKCASTQVDRNTVFQLWTAVISPDAGWHQHNCPITFLLSVHVT